MDPVTTGPTRSLDGPVHRACVVAGCWCHGSVRSAARPSPSRRNRGAGTPTIDLTAWRSVGLPVA